MILRKKLTYQPRPTTFKLINTEQATTDIKINWFYSEDLRFDVGVAEQGEYVRLQIKNGVLNYRETLVCLPLLDSFANKEVKL